MRNLLEGFDPASYTVVSRRPAHLGAVGVLPRSVGSRRLRGVLDRATEPALTAALAGLIASRRIAVVLATYPDLVHLAAAERAARITGTPLVGYLHDTVTAASTHRGRAKRAARVEARVWENAHHVFVMSQGMATLAAREGHAATPLEHVYPEGLGDPPTDPPDPVALWAGNVYEINAHAVARVSDAVGRAGLDMVFAGPKTVEQLAALGIRGDHVKTTFYADRKSYLEALGRASLLVLALDGDDESEVHRDELSTIFPTKTPEYVASGRPILVHCPKDWFLHTFAEERGFAECVSDRTPEALDAAVRGALANGPGRLAACRSTSATFDAAVLRDRLQEALDAAVA